MTNPNGHMTTAVSFVVKVLLCAGYVGDLRLSSQSENETSPAVIAAVASI
jgi:hypothetical protein